MKKMIWVVWGVISGMFSSLGWSACGGNHEPASSRTAGLRRSRNHERHEKGGTLSPGTADRRIGRFFVRAFFSLHSLRSLRLIPSGSLNYRTDFFRTGDAL